MVIFFSVTQSLELLKRKSFYLSKCALDYTIFPLCHSIFGTQYFIWQHYQLPNSCLLLVSFTSITVSPIAAFSPLPLCISPSSSHAYTVKWLLNCFPVSSLFCTLLPGEIFIKPLPRLKLQWFFKKQIIPLWFKLFKSMKEILKCSHAFL